MGRTRGDGMAWVPLTGIDLKNPSHRPPTNMMLYRALVQRESLPGFAYCHVCGCVFVCLGCFEGNPRETGNPPRLGSHTQIGGFPFCPTPPVRRVGHGNAAQLVASPPAGSHEAADKSLSPASWSIVAMCESLQIRWFLVGFQIQPLQHGGFFLRHHRTRFSEPFEPCRSEGSVGICVAERDFEATLQRGCWLFRASGKVCVKRQNRKSSRRFPPKPQEHNRSIRRDTSAPGFWANVGGPGRRLGRVPEPGSRGPDRFFFWSPFEPNNPTRA